MTSRDATVAESLARTLRHEVGDFLQKVYASVAILQDRLPADWSLEHEVLKRLRNQAEGCKHLIDAIQDFLCPLSMAFETIDLSHLAATVAGATRTAFPHVEIVEQFPGEIIVVADCKRVAQIGRALLKNACESGARRVVVRTASDEARQQAVWEIHDDGPGIAANVHDRIFQPFFTTRTGHAGLGLTLARKMAELHGGRLEAGNAPRGGFMAALVLPIAGPGQQSA